MGQPTALYQVSDLHFRYSERTALDGLSLQLEKGCFYGLLGPNGCGKTTFVDLLARLKNPDSGYIEFQGRNLSTISRRELAREIALVPQDFYINFPFTAREVIMMGRYPHMPRFASPSAEDIRAVESVMDRTDTGVLAEYPVTTLSGGERQRVVFARALAQGAPVILLDEATSNLDIRHTLQLLNLTGRLVAEQQYTVLAVFQDINLAAMYCDELLLMSGGRIVDYGPVADVLTSRTLESVFGVKSRIRCDSDLGTLQVVYER